jgi:hypothetical protein
MPALRCPSGVGHLRRATGPGHDHLCNSAAIALDDVLVVYGTTLQFNPSFDESLIEKALAEDPERYGAEYLSKWRDDLVVRAMMGEKPRARRPPSWSLQGLAVAADPETGDAKLRSLDGIQLSNNNGKR